MLSGIYSVEYCRESEGCALARSPMDGESNGSCLRITACMFIYLRLHVCQCVRKAKVRCISCRYRCRFGRFVKVE